MTERTYRQPQWKKTGAHPPRWQRDLNPDPLGGQNIGERATDHEPGARMASDDKEAMKLLSDFTMDELQEIPVLVQGARLEQGGTYVDLRDPDRRPFRATGQMVALHGGCHVPKAETPYPLWNRIIRAAPSDRQETSSHG
jgi:hypothetical protein